MMEICKKISKCGFLILFSVIFTATAIALSLLAFEKDKSLKTTPYRYENYCYDLETLKISSNPTDFENVTLCYDEEVNDFSEVKIYIESDKNTSPVHERNGNFLIDAKIGASRLKIYCMSSVDDENFRKEVSGIKVENADGKLRIIFEEIVDKSFGAIDETDLFPYLNIQYFLRFE